MLSRLLTLRINLQDPNLLSRDREAGATAVEYGLMVALIAVVVIVAVTLLGDNLSALFNTVATKV
jgi:pilus assembly protein Flp/PilA